MQPLLYALHSGNLYGTERMALATLAGLASELEPHLLAPEGPALDEARRLGFRTHAFRGALGFASALAGALSRIPRRTSLAFVATGLVHSLAFLGESVGRESVHLHLVHGGTDERLSYGRKRWLNGTAARIVAVSSFVRGRLLAHRVKASRIDVVENFLPARQVAACPKRGAFGSARVRRVLVVSRLDPIKRVDLLLDALDADPSLGGLEVRVLGTGWQEAALRERAADRNPNVTFNGFTSDVASELASSDLLVHLCPEEPFGLAILEAMAARVPVLVPDAGGAGDLVRDDVTGFRFAAGDALDLARRLHALAHTPTFALDGVVAAASAALETRFSERERLADYRRLLLPREGRRMAA